MKKLTSKKCIALVLAVVMAITSVPLMMVSALTTGSYDPAPYWGDGGEYSAINTNFVATLNTDGSVSISFPDAKAQKTYNGSSTKSIKKYVFTITKISEDGSKSVLWSESFDATKSYTSDSTGVFTITIGADYPNNIYYPSGALENLEGYDIQSTYDVSIMAIDSDGWFSDKIHTLLSDVPYYNITADFSPDEMWISRTLLDFESAGTAKFYGGSQSTSGYKTNGPGYKGSMYSEVSSDQSEIDYLYNVNGLVDSNGQMSGMGYNGSNAYRFWFSGDYTDTSFMFDSIWSRQHYDFTLQGVDNYEKAEVWFYVDFSRVDIGKMAFHLRANEKEVTTKRDGSNHKELSQYGVLFSTKAVKDINDIDNDGRTDDYINGDVQKGIYIQNAEGLWEETTMTGGYVTGLAGYKGFIRIPIEYFILQENQYITADNIREKKWANDNESGLETYRNNHMFLESSGKTVSIDGVACPYTTESISFVKNNESETLSVRKFLVNKAGTPVTDSMIIYDRFERKETLFAINVYNRELGSTIAFDIGNDFNTTYSNSMTVSGTNYNITSKTAPKAISDIASAGFEVADWSKDSLHKSFYLDQVLICQKVDESKQSQIVYDTDPTSTTYGRVADGSTVKFTGEKDFADDYGYVVKSYYDRTVEVPKIVAEHILEYIGEIPSLSDANAIEMINEIIFSYRECFPTVASTDNDEETIQNALKHLNALGYSEAVSRYENSLLFLKEYVGFGDSKRNENAVIAFESGVEKLDNPEFANYNDESLKAELEQLMALYKSFNLSHFEILGKEAEEKFTELYRIMMGEEVKTGHSIGAYPFIPFNDFETNYTIGQLSDLYFDDYPDYSDNKPADINSTGNFTTYVSDNKINQFAPLVGDARGWSPQDFRPTGETIGEGGAKYFSRMDAIITNKGFDNSHGATIRLHGELNSLNGWKMATLSTTYLGQKSDTNWGDLEGLDLSALTVKTDSEIGLDSQDEKRYGTGVLPNSFVMYVDLTDVKNICMNVKFILEDGDGNDVNCYYFGGAEDVYPTIYLLDENGDWQAQSLTITETDKKAPTDLGLRDTAPVTCTISSKDGLNALEGYKGFIRIPLSHFRIPDGTIDVDYKILDNILDDGYKIKQSKITFWDESGENVDKEIQIDAMGFTYDPSCATRTSTDVKTELEGDNSISVTNMDEYFRVKTNDSVNFEKMVAELDPYEGKEAFVKAYKEAHAAYGKLSEYQQHIYEVERCYRNFIKEWSEKDPTEGKYAQLGVNDGADYDTLIAKEPWLAKYATADDLIADIKALDSKATGFVINTDDKNDPNALAKLVPYNTSTGTIDYGALGFDDSASVEAVIEMYEKGYCRLSASEKATITEADFTSLKNAYNAAKRLLLLEKYIEDINKFKEEVKQIYTQGSKEPDKRMISYNNEKLITAINDYEDMSIFAKKMINETTTEEYTKYNYGKMYEAAEAIYDNSAPVQVSFPAEKITGGIVAFETRMKNCATDVAEKIRTRTILDASTLNEIEYCLGQTESFLPRYAQVDEINVAYHELADLLPFADMSSVDGDGNEITTITLNNDSETTMEYRAYIDLSYVATRLNKNVDLYAMSDLKWTQKQITGTTPYDFGYYYYDELQGSAEQGVITAKLGSYSNGNSSTFGRYSYKLSVDPVEASKVPTGSEYESTIVFYIVDPEIIAEKAVDNVTIEEVLKENEEDETLEHNYLERIEVKVEFKSTNGADPMSFELQIPAKVQVAWGDSSEKDVSYSVEAALGSNKLSVSVADDGTNKLTDSTGKHKLSYTTTNFDVATEFTDSVAAGTKPANAPSIKITGWDSVPVGEYSTQLTYTVDVTS